MISDVDHFFFHVFFSHLYTFEGNLFKSFAHFELDLFVFFQFLSCISSSYTVNIDRYQKLQFTSICSHYEALVHLGRQMIIQQSAPSGNTVLAPSRAAERGPFSHLKRASDTSQ